MAVVDLKVVMLGKEFCGKTSLVERYLNNRYLSKDLRNQILTMFPRFAGENRYQNTIGAAFGAREVRSRTVWPFLKAKLISCNWPSYQYQFVVQVEAGGRRVMVGVWDTAGSERYESMTRMYYR